jgi:MFS-type transporter involved in bile tolerance (Atg22 family)
MGFVLAFGVVSMLGDFVYEGARSVVGPFLATFGASAAMVGLVTGAGEAVALVFRLFSGRLSDRTGRHWALTITGYVITVVAVPILAAVQALWQAVALVVAERFGKAVRSPARDTMLAEAGGTMGRGRAFAIHEALDQSGALVGPLLVAGMVVISGYRLGFAVLAVPAAGLVAVLIWLRLAVPVPAAYDTTARATATPADADGTETGGTETGGTETGGAGSGGAGTGRGFSARFWLYAAFTALTMAGFATFGVLGYHLEVRHVLPAGLIPVTYAAAMGMAAPAALASGGAYDRWGLRGLVVLPPLALVVPFWSLSRSATLVWVGALVWGTAMGVHESTMRAAVADLVPAARRGFGYGVFTAVYGLAWLAGGALIGFLYDMSVHAVIVYTVVTQLLAMAAFGALSLTNTATNAARSDR